MLRDCPGNEVGAADLPSFTTGQHEYTVSQRSKTGSGMEWQLTLFDQILQRISPFRIVDGRNWGISASMWSSGSEGHFAIEEVCSDCGGGLHTVQDEGEGVLSRESEEGGREETNNELAPRCRIRGGFFPYLEDSNLFAEGNMA